MKDATNRQHILRVVVSILQILHTITQIAIVFFTLAWWQKKIHQNILLIAQTADVLSVSIKQ